MFMPRVSEPGAHPCGDFVGTDHAKFVEQTQLAHARTKAAQVLLAEMDSDAVPSPLQDEPKEGNGLDRAMKLQLSFSISSMSTASGFDVDQESCNVH